MLNRIIALFKNKKNKRNITNYCESANIQLISPFSISDIEHLIVDCKDEEYVYIGPGAWLELRGYMYIGSGTIIGPRLKVHTANHNWDGEMLPYDDKYIIKDVHIGKNVWIGSDVSIMAGVSIGEGAIVAANSVVTKDVPPLTLVGGNPAKEIKKRDSNKYQRLKSENRIYLSLKKQGKTITNEEKRLIRK